MNFEAIGTIPIAFLLLIKDFWLVHQNIYSVGYF
jgi:hypothetical protein